MSGLPIWHIFTSDFQVYGVCADTAGDARGYLNGRLDREAAEDPEHVRPSIVRTLRAATVPASGPGGWSVGSVLLYGDAP